MVSFVRTRLVCSSMFLSVCIAMISLNLRSSLFLFVSTRCVGFGLSTLWLSCSDRLFGGVPVGSSRMLICLSMLVTIRAGRWPMLLEFC